MHLLVSYCPFGLQGPLRASVPIILYSEYFELGLSKTESLSVELAMIYEHHRVARILKSIVYFASQADSTVRRLVTNKTDKKQQCQEMY